MKKFFIPLLLASGITAINASQIPLPTCVDGQWQIKKNWWTVTQSQPCSSDSELLPAKIHGLFVNPRHGARFTMTVNFYDTKGQLAVTTSTQVYAPWGNAWTGNKRSNRALCPSETGQIALEKCPIVNPYGGG